MKTVALARQAMNTRFELLLHGESEPALRAAGEAALDEVERLEAQLSLFRPTSEVAHINRNAAERPVKVSPPVFRLLRQAQALVVATGGAFDPTVGPLVRAWGFRDGTGALPELRVRTEARECVGMGKILLDEDHFTVRFAQAGMVLDLGALGKGYALDCAVELLREADVTSGFIHGGTSSAYGLGLMPDGRSWQAAIPNPENHAHRGTAGTSPVADTTGEILARMDLQDASLGVSAVWGKAFQVDGRVFGHVLDPRTGEPVQGALLAGVVLPSATETDALSTALLVLGAAGFERLRSFRPELRGLVVLDEPDGRPWRVVSHGLPCADDACPG